MVVWDEPGARLMWTSSIQLIHVTLEVVPVVNADYVKKIQTAVSSGTELPDYFMCRNGLARQNFKL